MKSAIVLLVSMIACATRTPDTDVLDLRTFEDVFGQDLPPEPEREATAEPGFEALVDLHVKDTNTSTDPKVVEEVILQSLPQVPEGSVYIVNDEGTEHLRVAESDTFTGEIDGKVFTLYPYVRFRLPGPGIVKNIFVFVPFGQGTLRLHVSRGFPGGHYPCLDEATGQDQDKVGPKYVMNISDKAGWRVFSVDELGLEVAGYEEFFVIFEQEGDTRVGLGREVARQQGDYDSYGGLIADVPGDGMNCFPTVHIFQDEQNKPLVWLIRAEVRLSKKQSPFFQASSSGPNRASHAAFADVDSDGDEDLFAASTLWLNTGEGIFQQTESAVTASGPGIFGDYDNDGNPDLLVLGEGVRLFRGLGDGRFEDVTESAGITVAANVQSAVWLDFDADGWLDFYAAAYGTLADPEVPHRDFLYRNLGNGRFEDVTGQMGMPTDKPRYHGRGVAVADYDQDGDPDIYVGNYRLDPNQLWQNLGGLSGFVEVSAKAGVQGDWSIYGYGHTIGPAFGDLNGDQKPDIIVPNLAHPRFLWFSDRTMVYMNLGDGTFNAIRTPDAGIIYDETHSHAVLFDMDSDGDLDVYLTAVYPGRRAFLYENDGSGYFRDVTWEAGVLHLDGWGAAVADVDRDLDLDLMAGNLWVNKSNGRSIMVKLEGGARPGDVATWSNRDAVGATVLAEVGNRKIWRQVEGGSGTGCQNSKVIHIGLGQNPKVERLTVYWPSGRTQVFEHIEAGTFLTIKERE